jgi:protein gp37
MAETSGIGWTDATFNPWWGCFPVSPGCALCYADREAARYGYSDLWEKEGPRRTFGEHHWNEPRRWAKKAGQEMVRRKVLAASMGDIGDAHPVCAAERPKLWSLIEETDELDYLLLTKRVETAREWLPARWFAPGGWPRNAWFGFSAEDQERYDLRWSFVREIPAPVRFCSYEPALGGIDFGFPGVLKRTKPAGFDEMSPDRQEEVIAVAARAEYMARADVPDWIIAGGESSRPRDRARAPHPAWFRSARDQAVAAGVPFFFKQWGEYAPVPEGEGGRPGDVWVCDNGPGKAVHRQRWTPDSRGAEPGRWGAGDVLMRPVGKKVAGDLLEGKTWQQFPVVGNG